MSGIPIKGAARGTPEQAYETALERDAARHEFLRDYFTALYADAKARGINADALVAQWDLETGSGTSRYWVRDGNPAGLAAFDDGSNWGLTFSPQKAARAHVTHMARYLGLDDVPADWIASDARWDAASKYAGTVTTTDDLGNGRWATDPNYGTKLKQRYEAYFGPYQEAPPMNIPVSAPPLRISIMPFNNANRPKLTMNPEYITVHEVGNTSPGADEEMHRRFVHNGGGSSQVSFQFVVGPTEAIQLMPLDEAAWHASDGYNGTGNRKSIAIETIQIGNFDKTLWHLAWLINELATNPGRFYANVRKPEWNLSTDRIKQHNDWAPDNKNCPQFIRDRGLWGTLMQRVDAWNAAGEPQPEPEPEPKPDPIPEEKHQLPDGMTPQLASRLFGSYVAPWEGTPYVFDIDQAPSQVWLSRGKKSIPAGKTWAAGQWPSLNTVIRRGDGGQVWVWSDGSTYERKAPKEKAA